MHFLWHVRWDQGVAWHADSNGNSGSRNEAQPQERLTSRKGWNTTACAPALSSSQCQRIHMALKNVLLLRTPAISVPVLQTVVVRRRATPLERFQFQGIVSVGNKQRVRIAVIGPTTASFMRDILKLHVDVVAPRPTSKDLASVIAAFDRT